MNNFQIAALIIGSTAIIAILIGSMLFKPKKIPQSDIRLDLDPSVEQSPETGVRVTEEAASAPEPVVAAFNRAAFQEWYKKVAKAHAKSLRKAGGTIRFFFIAQGILMLFGIFTLASVAADPGDEGIWIILAIGIVMYVAMLLYYVHEKNKSIADALSSSKYVELGKHQFSAIWTVCADLMQKMEITDYSLRIFYVKTDFFEASVLVEDKEANLLLSRSLISYFHHHPKDVESILGHEFGHVCQGDSKMLLVNRRTIQVPAIIGIASCVVLAIQAIAALMQGRGLPQVGGSMALVFAYMQLVSARKEAEYLADMASLAFVENSTIVELISKYMPERMTFNYPSRQQRINFIKGIWKKVDSPSYAESA